MLEFARTGSSTSLGGAVRAVGWFTEPSADLGDGMESQAPEKIRVRTASVCIRPEVAVHSGHRSRMGCLVLESAIARTIPGIRRPKDQHPSSSFGRICLKHVSQSTEAQWMLRIECDCTPCADSVDENWIEDVAEKAAPNESPLRARLLTST